jgi:tRNA(fMet)-specific endonuclease VapC
MRRVLLDTSAYSAFKRGHEDALAAVRTADELIVSAIVIGELLFGFRRGDRRTRNETELSTLLASPRVITVGIDRDTSERYALIRETLTRAGTPVAANDIWISATAMQYGATVLTADRDFLQIPQIVVELLPVL